MAVAIWLDDSLQSSPKTCWKVAKLSSSDVKNWLYPVISTGMYEMCTFAYMNISCNPFFVLQLQKQSQVFELLA